jgi:D-arabinose 1-dehydrogenase-like Zn-dependent alcohol dehydrogenase
MSRAIAFNGDGTWHEIQRAVPDPRPGGAVLRVEATGLCHTDIDHFHGHVHTPWGGAFPSVPGHEIVGRIERISPAAASEWTRGTVWRSATS